MGASLNVLAPVRTGSFYIIGIRESQQKGAHGRRVSKPLPLKIFVPPEPLEFAPTRTIRSDPDELIRRGVTSLAQKKSFDFIILFGRDPE
jgi:hypothetical protein